MRMWKGCVIFLRYRDHINIKFYLVRWQYYQEQRYHLEDSEKENATVLFNALYSISLEDRKLLSEKYYESTLKANYDTKKGVYQTVKPIKNSVLCLRHSLSEERFSQRMREAERNLKSKMFEVYEQMYDKLKEFKLMIGKGLYFKDHIGEDGQYSYLLSQSVAEGKVFTMGINNSEYYDLKSLGFRKVPTK